MVPKYARITSSLIKKIFSLGSDISANRLARILNLNKNTIIYRIRKFELKEIESSYIGIDDFFQNNTKESWKEDVKETLDKIHLDLINQIKFNLIMEIKDLYSKNMSYISIEKLTHIDNRTVKKYCHLAETEIEKLRVSHSLISKNKHYIGINELWKEGVAVEKI
ncbi:hypothetical protein [Cetobacterium sp.]|uniref:hypothetical protein n=1 Tax=Cetobacterium sp. TaxID=2071632 RepID=UPI002FCC4BB2